MLLIEARINEQVPFERYATERFNRYDHNKQLTEYDYCLLFNYQTILWVEC